MSNVDATNVGKPPRVPYFTPERLAVSLLFLANGLFIGSWAPKIPVFAERLGLSPGALGLMILVFGIGSLIFMPIAGSQIARFGSVQTVKVATALFLPTLILLTYVPSILIGVVALFVFGGLTGAMDIAMNANAVETEKFMRRSIMSSCHAFWSVGTFIGASSGGWLIAQFGAEGHAFIVTAIDVAIVAVAWNRILHDKPHAAEVREKARLPLSPLPWLLGFMALFSMIPEGAVLDWGALYLHDELGAPLKISGFAFGAFSFTMAIMRFAGDFVRDRFGAVAVFRFCTIMAIIGMLLVGAAPNVAVAIAGFAIAGIGISNMVPIAFSAAGNLPGFAQGVALSVVTFMGYSGVLAAPSVIGFVAEYTSFSLVYMGLPVFLVAVLALSGLARHADSIKEGTH